MPTAPPGMSATQASTILQSMDRRLAAFHEVETVFGKMGRADTATDPAPIGMVETTIVLRPRDQWRPGVTWESLIAEMDAALRIPGMPNVWWMPVQTRTEMLATGVRSPLGIQVFGDNLEEIESTATAIEAALGDVPGTRSVFAERAGGGFFVDLSLRRADAARYGISVADLDRVIATAIGGLPVSEWIDGRRRYPLTVRYGREYRDTPEALGQVLIRTSSGAQIPIAEVADLAFTTGPDMVRSEDGKLVGFVFVDTERAIADYVADARRRVDERVAIPAGVRIAWVGQFKYYERARETLAVLLPITLAIVVGLLWWNTRSLVETCIVLTALPFSLVGAVWLLWFLDYNVSVAVWVGIIALAGLDAETGVVMLLYLSLAWKRATKDRPLADLAALRACIVDGAARRLRPKLMTVATTMIGLLPILWSDGTGADVMKRIAAPMVGGLATSFLLELTVYPALFAIWKERELAPPASAGP
jgi:Cu(I)/Ag(I) efflux system membrane protein CusA/SilA